MNPDEKVQIETRITIRIALPSDISEQIIKVKKKTGVYYPNAEDTIPHITLYACKFDESAYESLLNKLREVSQPSFALALSPVKTEIHNKYKEGNIFVYFGFEETDALEKLHQEVVSIANPLRGNLIRYKDIERFKKGLFSEEEFSFIEQYGYQYVGKNFNSHITIGEVEKEKAFLLEEVKEDLNILAGQTFRIDKFFVKLTKRIVPSEEKVFKSEITEIHLG